MPMDLEYSIVDVFTEKPLEGNPLAVVQNTVNLSTEQMQRIAREFNLSETTFVQRRPAEIENREGVRVRIFTTQEELAFAGHPTLGTASILRETAPEVVANDTVTLAQNVGPVPVRFSPGTAFGEMTQRDPEFGSELDATAVATLCGFEVSDLDPHLPPQIVSTGTAFAIVPLRAHWSLAKMKVNDPEATDWLRKRGARWFYVLAPTGGVTPQWRARMQFNGGEDPATGSAAGCAVSYLVQRGTVMSGHCVHLRQGVEMGRPSELFLSAQLHREKVGEVRVGGSTILVAKGRLFLP